jgi:hypothetical protein
MQYHVFSKHIIRCHFLTNFAKRFAQKVILCWSCSSLSSYPLLISVTGYVSGHIPSLKLLLFIQVHEDNEEQLQHNITFWANLLAKLVKKWHLIICFENTWYCMQPTIIPGCHTRCCLICVSEVFPWFLIEVKAVRMVRKNKKERMTTHKTKTNECRTQC